MYKHRKLGDILLEAGAINREQLEHALTMQKHSGLKLGDQLVELGFISEQLLIEVLEKQLDIDHIILHQVEIDPNLINLVSEEMAKQYFVLPVRKMGNRLAVAMADPLDYYAIDDLRLSTGFRIEPLIAKKEELRIAINRYYGMQQSIDQMMAEMTESGQSEQGVEEQVEAPAAKIVNQLIRQGMEMNASDIHIDPEQDETVIRLRVDGLLRIERTLPRFMHAVVISRIKILARLDIAEKRLPQDGRFQFNFDGRKADVRVSILPTIFGEKAVLRLLDKGRLLTDLDQLHFSADNLTRFKGMIRRPYGLVLVTGPTGSGKTTTLYTALQSINKPEINIITLEEPVEYQIEGINQVQVNPAIGLTFSTGLRSILRQDPNVIMVGEIRDLETAEMTLQAAMTGHLVLSTLHTNDALSTIARLIDMGVERFLISSALSGVVAQRLVRKICTHCAFPEPVDEVTAKLFADRGISIKEIVRGKGCPDCYHSGYRGQLAIQEVLELNGTLRRLILDPSSDISQQSGLHNKGFKTMMDDGLEKAAQGLTTLDEVYRAALIDQERGGENRV